MSVRAKHVCLGPSGCLVTSNVLSEHYVLLCQSLKCCMLSYLSTRLGPCSSRGVR